MTAVDIEAGIAEIVANVVRFAPKTRPCAPAPVDRRKIALPTHDASAAAAEPPWRMQAELDRK